MATPIIQHESGYNWDSQAATYAHLGRLPADITAFVDFIKPQNHAVIVDMGCGAGLLSKAMLERTGGTAKLTCFDISQPLLARTVQ